MSYTANAVFLGFDFGVKRIGVAVGQLLTRSARPLLTIQVGSEWDCVWKQIDDLLNKWNPVALVVGLPLNMDGSTQSLTFVVQDFVNQLSRRYGLPVHTSDERLTSTDAKEQLFITGGYKALVRGRVDMMAAKLILQDWLISYQDR